MTSTVAITISIILTLIASIFVIKKVISNYVRTTKFIQRLRIGKENKIIVHFGEYYLDNLIDEYQEAIDRGATEDETISLEVEILILRKAIRQYYSAKAWAIKPL